MNLSSVSFIVITITLSLVTAERKWRRHPGAQKIDYYNSILPRLSISKSISGINETSTIVLGNINYIIARQPSMNFLCSYYCCFSLNTVYVSRPCYLFIMKLLGNTESILIPRSTFDVQLLNCYINIYRTNIGIVFWNVREIHLGPFRTWNERIDGCLRRSSHSDIGLKLLAPGFSLIA